MLYLGNKMKSLFDLILYKTCGQNHVQKCKYRGIIHKWIGIIAIWNFSGKNITTRQNTCKAKNHQNWSKNGWQMELLPRNKIITRHDLVARNKKVLRPIFRKWHDIIDFVFRQQNMICEKEWNIDAFCIAFYNLSIKNIS